MSDRQIKVFLTLHPDLEHDNTVVVDVPGDPNTVQLDHIELKQGGGVKIFWWQPV